MLTPALDSIVRAAIAGRRLVGLTYHGRRRVAEPHDYGVVNGTTRLLVFQLRDEAKGDGDRARGWRLLDVEKIGTCEMLAETFAGSRGAAHQRHREWDVVYARVG